MMLPTDRIQGQEEQDPGQVINTSQEARTDDFLAVVLSPTLHIFLFRTLCDQRHWSECRGILWSKKWGTS